MYLILDKFSLHSQNLLEVEDPTSYDIVSIIYIASLLRNQPTGFFKFVNKFISQVYLLNHEEIFPRVCLELQACLHPSAKAHIGDWFLYKNYIVLRVYGVEVNPYRFPSFFNP